jgi:hypothetical protein
VNYQVKKMFILPVAMATVIGISTGNPFSDEWKGNMVYASNELMSGSELDNYSTAAIKGNTEKFKAEFAYEMAQITARIVSAPATNAENFKVEFAYATAKVTTKVMPILPSGQRSEFAYEMAQITAKIVSDQNLDIEKAKAEFTYEIAQLTAKIITNADTIAIGNRTPLKVNDQKTLFRNNADIEPKAAPKQSNTATNQKTTVNTGYIAPETYNGLMDELMHVGKSKPDHKVNMGGEIRYHFALNQGSSRWDKDSSGFRAYFDADTAINKDWRVYGMLEGQANVINYNNVFKLSRLYVAGKLGSTSMLRAGSFGYLMAEGNIYDSDFKGVRAEFGDAFKYTVGLGETDSTQKTYIATARYADYDYNLEAGVYRYQTDDGTANQNTIRTFAGNYNFSNFGVGAMILSSTLKDSQGDGNGYVFSFKYGDLKTWRPYTYSIFAKYYNQPRYTYIAHGMNGVGSAMGGFTGYGLGMNYTLAPNFVAGIEYYDLTDKISGEKVKLGGANSLIIFNA